MRKTGSRRCASDHLDEHNLAIEVTDTRTGGSEESWKLIGSCGFFNLDQRNRSSEFGIMIGDKSYWNKGYGTEAVRLLASMALIPST